MKVNKHKRRLLLWWYDFTGQIGKWVLLYYFEKDVEIIDAVYRRLCK